jgi:hypothetical protein
MEDVIIYSTGIVACSVCADNSLSIKKITRIVNDMNPTYISSKWKLSKDKTFKNGEPNPCVCEQNPDTRKHYLFNC